MNREYFAMMRDLIEAPVTSPRGMKTKELIGQHIFLDNPKAGLITLPGFETNLDYAEKELNWYLSGTNKLSGLGKFGKCWKFCSDDGMHVNSAYGHRIFGVHPKIKINQWQWCLKKLTQDRDSRQCVINLNSEFDKHKKTKDFICTVFCQVLVRHERLHWLTYMRSTDAYLGVRNDIFCFAALQRIMAHQLGIKIGKYHHFASSLHLYEKQFVKARKLVNSYDLVREIKNIYYPMNNIRELIKKYSDNLGGNKKWILK